MNDSFVWVFSIIIGILLLMLWSLLRITPVVKAGKVSKFCWEYKLLYGRIPTTINCHGKKVDVSSCKDMYVCGNSMKDYKISDGQQIFVSPYRSEGQKESITNFPILVFYIYNVKYQSHFKLRKFVCYILNPLEKDWGQIYNDFKSRIKIGKEEFIAELKVKQGNLTTPQEKHILSETFDEDDNRYHYSLHPISSLYGKAICTLKK